MTKKNGFWTSKSTEFLDFHNKKELKTTTKRKKQTENPVGIKGRKLVTTNGNVNF